jgi:hypothetical protein
METTKKTFIKSKCNDEYSLLVAQTRTFQAKRKPYFNNAQNAVIFLDNARRIRDQAHSVDILNFLFASSINPEKMHEL